MGALAAAFCEEALDNKYQEMVDYLSSEGGYWLKEDIWYLDAAAVAGAGIEAPEKHWKLADFSGYASGRLKTEMKYYLLYHLKKKYLTALGAAQNYLRAVRNIGKWAGKDTESFGDIRVTEVPQGLGETEGRVYRDLLRRVAGFIADCYDTRDEFGKDIWNADRIPGVKRSAAEKRVCHSVNFTEIPSYYRGMTKRFLSRLVVRRSWSYSTEMLMYIRYFFKVFYGHGYGDGFLEALSRKDVEAYLGWIAEDYRDRNATYRSKAVAFIRQFIDYIQLAEYEGAPEKDVGRLIFDDDIPRRERAADTMEKVKYIPLPVREQLDASVQELEPPEMQPVYVLLRESGWRGTDVLNLRYDSCLEYIWNEKQKEYIPYLCGEITKTGIPMLKIPLRKEVADMVKRLADGVKARSTDENNPDRYLFNTFEGKNMGLPYSKPAFSRAVNELIGKKGILGGDGEPYHFKAHSLRHTRAMEYTEQRMPIGVISQALGHCSIQMTLHYARVSENMLYEKWKETEELGLLHLESRPPRKQEPKEEGLHYESIRKNLDAVKVPFGLCCKPSKLSCRQQAVQCMECASFCTCRENAEEYEAEIGRVRKLLEISEACGREEWLEKNRKYLETLEGMLSRIRSEGVIHKNGRLREAGNG